MALKEIISNSQNKIFSISGTAGTGKTLLTYDIAKELRNIGKSVTIIHCAQFNNGITKLITQYQWDIRTIKNYSISPLSNILIVDEAQRLEKSQFEALVSIGSKTIIFSHDVNQRLNRTNQAQEVVALIKLNAHKSPYELSHKIRHNKSLASFLKKFYDLTKITTDTLVCKDYENIFFYYAKNLNDAQTYVSFLMTNGWEYIYLTNSRYNQESLSRLKFSDNSAHQAIGQEYDNVVVIIDQNFFYKENKKLAYRTHCYYSPLETLFQAITRTRKRIMFVIIDNKEVYKNCIKIINRESIS